MFSPRNSFDGVNICFIKDEDLLFYVSQTDQAFQMILFSGDSVDLLSRTFLMYSLLTQLFS